MVRAPKNHVLETKQQSRIEGHVITDNAVEFVLYGLGNPRDVTRFGVGAHHAARVASLQRDTIRRISHHRIDILKRRQHFPAIPHDKPRVPDDLFPHPTASIQVSTSIPRSRASRSSTRAPRLFSQPGSRTTHSQRMSWLRASVIQPR